MTKQSASLITALLIYVCSYAQSGDFYSLKDVKKYRFDRLELNTEKEKVQFASNATEFNFIEALKISGDEPLETIFNRTSACNYIRELNLSGYTGSLSAHAFDSCKNLEILHLNIPEDKLEQIQHIGSLKNLSVLYLYISGKPEDLKPLAYLPGLKELHIIGDFLPAQLHNITNYIQEQTLMQVLGISVDRITDLPASITRFKTLSKLILYDNQSVAANKGIEELNEEKMSIIFNLYSDMINAISVSYFSLNNKLADFESEYLQKLYKGELMPQQFAEQESSETDGSEIPFEKEFVPDFAVTPEFSYPYPLISPATELFTINPNTGNVLYSATGMKITIPSGCFTDAAGNVITETIYLRVMQMQSATDILFAGLNLKIGDRQLSSRYLFNIQATTSKSTASMKEGYQLKVSIPTSRDSAVTYFFDYESYTWQDHAFYEKVFAQSFVPTDFYKIESSGNHNACYQFDTGSFSTRFTGKHNYFLNDRYNQAQMLFRKGRYYTDLDRTWNREYNKDGKLKGLKIKRGKSFVKIQKVIPKNRNREKQYFKILDKTEQGVFIELRALRNINLCLSYNPENKKAFNESYIKNARYCDVRIDYKTGKDFCEIVFKTPDGFKKLKAEICDTDNKELRKKQILKFHKAFRNYEKLLLRREAEFNSLNKQRFNEFITYTGDRQNTLEKNGSTSEFKIHQLGTFGMMYEKSPEFASNIIAQYTDEKGIPVDVKALFLIDSRYNTVFRKEVGNIQFDPSNCYLIVATDYNGNLYYANKTDIAAAGLSDNSLTYIKLKKAGRGIGNIQTFNQLIKN